MPEETKKKKSNWFQKRWKWILLFLVEILLLVFFLPGWLDSLIIAFSLLLALASLIYFDLAPRDLFFTFVPEGTAKVVTFGRAYRKTLIQYVGYRVDDHGAVVRGEERHCLGGLRGPFLWPFFRIFAYRFSWTTMNQDGDIEVHPETLLDYIYVRAGIYYLKISGGEDINGFPIDLEISLTLRIVNPRKALLRIVNWLQATTISVRSAGRNVLTSNSYFKWISDKDDVAKIIFGRLKEGLGGTHNEKEPSDLAELEREYGVKILQLKILSVEPPEKAREATLKKWYAEREAEAIEVLAKVEAKRRSIVYEKVREFGELGKLMSVLETLEKSDLGMASLHVVPGMLGLSDTLQNLFGGHAPNNTDLSWLRDELKRLRAIMEEGQGGLL